MWNKKDIDVIFDELKTREIGLSNEEVKLRQTRDGKNYFPKSKQDSLIKIIFKQFKNSIIIILFVAIFFAVIIGETANAIFIGAVIIINTIIGTIQEYNAEKSAEKLQKMIKVNCNVIRNNQNISVDSEDLVVGDIILLSSGNKVPADIRLIDVFDFETDESVLTGESDGIKKTNEVSLSESSALTYNNMAYAGSIVLRGRSKGIVVETGLNTELGKIAGNVINMKDELSPLVIRINRFSKQISIIFTVLICILSIILFFKGFLIKDIFFSVIALTISAIPEGLSTAMTISLSISSKRMAKKNVIVKKLSAVESLGSCTVIASDKTGTLTVNEQTAKVIKFPFSEKIEVTGEGYNNIGNILYDENDAVTKKNINLLVQQGVLNNDAFLTSDNEEWKFSGDSIDVAFLSLGEKFGVNNLNLDNIDIISKIPYESENKYSAVYFNEGNKNYFAIKGAPEKVLHYCNKMIDNEKIKKIDKDEIMQQNESLANEGYRVIALAYSETKKLNIDKWDDEKVKNLTFIGLVGFMDPVKSDAIVAVNECKKAGLKVYMITGDHPKTAYFIAKKLNIIDSYDEVVTGEMLDYASSRGNEYFDTFIKNIKVCARVSPLQKLMVVESLKRQDEFVAVTGDGVNDAPALKSANIGVAMGSGTDLAKETGDMILIDDNFASLVGGIKEGRIAYNNIRSVIYLLLSTGFSEVILYILSIIFNFPFPLLAIQFLWLNLITNGIESNAMAFEKSSYDVMEDKQKDKNDKIFNKLFIEETLISSLLIGVMAFLMFYVLYKVLNLDIILVRTYLLVFMVFAENMQIFNCRSEKISAFNTRFKNNIFLISCLLVSYLTQTIILYIPFAQKLFNVVSIPFIHIILIFILTIPILVVMELYKDNVEKNKKALN